MCCMCCAAATSGPGLSSPHLRTHSASEPPRSVVLLGKRSAGAGDDAEDTPASRRSVRQRMDGGKGIVHVHQAAAVVGGE
jgi:hypothetical protein